MICGVKQILLKTFNHIQTNLLKLKKKPRTTGRRGRQVIVTDSSNRPIDRLTYDYGRWLFFFTKQVTLEETYAQQSDVYLCLKMIERFD